MKEIGEEVDRAFALFGHIADEVDAGAMRAAVDFAKKEWKVGRPGPIIASPAGAEPAYSLTLSPDKVDVLWQGERGSLPTQVFVDLGDIAALQTIQA